MIRAPRSLFGQLMLALGVGLIIAQGLAVWFLLEDQAQERERMTGVHTAQRVANLIQLLNDSSPALRPDLVKALNVFPFRRIHLDQPWQPGAAIATQPAETFARLLLLELGPSFPLHILSFGKTDPSHSTEAPGPPRRPPGTKGTHAPAMQVVLQVRLRDGTVATLHQAFPPLHSEGPQRIMGLLALMGLTIALSTAWVVRRLTRPLSALAEAANGLPLDLDQAPVPESGPAEVAAVARAFNTMQGELRKLLETRTQALAGVSHDLRLPITRLRLRLERLGDAKLKADIGGELDEMDGMIDTTLDFLRAGHSVETPVRLNLQALIETVAEEMEDLGAIIRLHGDAQTPILARPLALRRCLSNLIDNARRYGGGQAGDGPVDVSVEQGECQLEIRVEDRGPGIPPEAREHVFEPYVRLETSRGKNTGGSGLGLAIARAIARHEGGDIRLEARPGGGLSAVLSLPCSAR